MLQDLPAITKLLKTLQQVPYLASKNIYRVATHFLDMDPVKLEQFCQALQEARQAIAHCQTCYFWCEQDKPCSLCVSTKRDQTVICVVETWQELIAIEKTGGYNGVYHILGGVISPLDGRGPEHLTIEQLVMRIQNNNVQELILATNQTPEGEATASFIAHRVRHTKVTISCLARGIPVGSSLEFMDRLTVYKALAERRLF